MLENLQNIIFITLFFLLNIQGLYSYEELYLKFYDKPLNCQSELTSYWKVVNGSFKTPYNCQVTCTMNGGSNTLPFFQLSNTIYTEGFEISKLITQPASIVGVDIIYYVHGQFTMTILSDDIQLISETMKNSPSDPFPQEVIYSPTCSGQTTQAVFRHYQSNVKNISKLRVKFTNLPSIYGFIKLYLWANCNLNCKTCIDDKSCSECLLGHRLITMPSGQKVCTQTSGCTKQNCQECAKSNSNEICTSCIPGYKLDGSNNCIQELPATCSSDHYRQNGSCYAYSSICSMQMEQGYKYCYQIPNNLKCRDNQRLVLHMIGNYSTYHCGCTVEFCEQCISNDCTKCQEGYTLSGSQCQPNAQCPLGKIKNQSSKRCDPETCSGQNCKKCDEFLCYECISTDYYVDGNNPINCKQCTVQNCEKCGPDGKCFKCKVGFFVDDKGNCNDCISNCEICDDANTCNKCVQNYLLSQDKQQCQCDVKYCKKCSQNDGSICLNCQFGKYDNFQKKCLCSVSNCEYCKEDNQNECNTCVGFYQQDKGQCICTISNCTQCNQIGDQCLTCINNYTKSQDQKKCSCSVKYCNQCDPLNGQICKECNQGFELDEISFQCIAKVKNCNQVDPTNGNRCMVCTTGYESKNNSCDCSVQNCEVCNNNNGSICDTCTKGYLQEQNSTHCGCSVKNCQICNKLDGTICDQCITGFKSQNDSKECACQLENCSRCEYFDGKKCEQCQTGYDLSLNKTCECNAKNCLKCNLQDGNKCDSCAENYVLDPVSFQCVRCIDNCLQCEYSIQKSNSICKKCKEKHYLEQITDQKQNCQRICEVLACNQCDPQDHLKCQKCDDGFSPVFQNQFCQDNKINSFFIEQEKFTQGYYIYVEFNNDLIVKNQLQEILEVNITNYIEIQDYIIIELTQVQNKKIKISVTMKKNCKGQKMKISLKDEQFIQTNNLNEQIKEIELKDYVQLNEEQLEQIQQTKDITEGVKTTLYSTLLPLVLIGHLYMFFSTIDMTTFIYFLLYVKVRYPDNVIAFCQIFKNFQFAFVPNLWQVYVLEGYSQNYTPEMFLQNGSDAYFLNGGGQSMTIIVGIITIYLILKILAFQQLYKPLALYVQRKIKSGWEYCGFFDLIWTVYMYVLVSSFLQFYCFEFSDTYSFINYFLWIMSLLAVFIIPIWITIFINNTKNLSCPHIQQTYGSLIGGLKLHPQDMLQKVQFIEQSPFSQEELKQQSTFAIQTNKAQVFIQDVKDTNEFSIRKQRMYKWSKYANVILYFRKILYAAFIICFANLPYLHLASISILNIILAIYYLYIKPHDKNLDNYRNGFGEIILVFMQITIMFLVDDENDQPEQDRINIGWIFITCAAFILVMHIFSVVFDLLKGIFNLIKDFIITVYKFKKEYYLKKKQNIIERQQRFELQKVVNKVLSINKFMLKRTFTNNNQSFLSINKLNPDSSFMSSHRGEQMSIKESQQKIINKSNESIPKSLQNIHNINNNSQNLIQNNKFNPDTSILSNRVEQMQIIESQQQIMNSNKILKSQHVSLNQIIIQS